MGSRRLQTAGLQSGRSNGDGDSCGGGTLEEGDDGDDLRRDDSKSEPGVTSSAGEGVRGMKKVPGEYK